MKRADIQGLRTVAILAVIFYHIWPTHFPNGFLGVDVFFVISGNLMAGCLANLLTNCSSIRSEKVRNKLLQFYARRVKRIVPIYIAIICGTLSVSRTIMLDSDFQKARADMYWALAFIANVQTAFEDSDYFAEVFSYRPFLHCWSLGVEMQFYLLVPVAMLLLLSLHGAHQRLLRHCFCSTVMIASVTVQQLLTTVMPALSFGFVFARLWQFFAGILVHFLNISPEDQQAQQEELANETTQTAQTTAVGQIGWPYVLGAADKGTAPNSVDQPAAQIHGPPSSAISASPPPVPRSSTASLSITSSSSLSPPCSATLHQHKQQDTKNGKSNLALAPFLWHSAAVHLLLLLLLLALFVPFSVPAPFTPFQNTFVVILVAVQLHVHHQPQQHHLMGGLFAACPPSPLLTNVIAVQLGDLSYIWYLVHWPVIVFIKYFFTVDQFSTKNGIFTLLLTLLLALLLDRLLDANIRRLPNFCSVLLLIGLLYTFCFFLVLPTYYSGQIERIATVKDYDGSLGQRAVTLDTNFTKMIINELQQNVESRKRLVNTLSLYEKIKMNELLQSATFEDRYKLLPGEERTERWIDHLKNLLIEDGNKTPQNLLKFVIERHINGKGNGTVLLVGNSHADVVSRELGEEMGTAYHKFITFSMPGCMPIAMPDHFIPFDPGHIIPCQFFTRTVRKMVEQIKPDALFMVFRWYNELQNVPFDENGTKHDELLNAFRHELRHFQKFTKHIVMSAPTIQFKHEVAKELAKRLWQHAPLDELHLSRQEHYRVNRFSYARLGLIDCAKCVLFDLADHFCDQRMDKCWAFDEQTQLANFFDNNHLSYLGRQAVRPYLRAMRQKIGMP